MDIVGHTRPLRPARRRRCRTLVAIGAVALAAVGASSWNGAPAAAAIVPTVQLGTATDYSVLAGSTVTNTGPTIVAGSVGVSPGSAVTGFPPGIVLAPGTIHAGDAEAAAAQADLTAAYVDAAGRPIDATTTADLGGLVLVGGVYAGPSKSALTLTGPLVLDGGGDPTSVFIFQTDSTLTTGSASTVTLINGAQECNVFWQVGSSATLGTGSTFTGTILALTSVTVTTDVTVRGRALARNGAVTLDSDDFTNPTCADGAQPTTTTDQTTSSTVASTTSDGSSSTAVPTTLSPSTGPATAPTTPGGTLPSTGATTATAAGLAFVLLSVGWLAILVARRRLGSPKLRGL